MKDKENTFEQAEEPRFVVYGDFGANYGWVVDNEAYIAMPWWKRDFKRNSVIVWGGPRDKMRGLADKMNATGATGSMDNLKLIAEDLLSKKTD